MTWLMRAFGRVVPLVGQSHYLIGVLKGISRTTGRTKIVLFCAGVPQVVLDLFGSMIHATTSRTTFMNWCDGFIPSNLPKYWLANVMAMGLFCSWPSVGDIDGALKKSSKYNTCIMLQTVFYSDCVGAISIFYAIFWIRNALIFQFIM